MNTSGEAGRECAALATVFGVPEYVDSKIFWDRQQQQQQQQERLTKAGEGNKYGHVCMNRLSLTSRPLSSSFTMNEVEIAHANELSSYVDSVLDPVAAFNPSLGPVPQPTKSFSLPKIPTVSKFNDILADDELMIPANPSSIIIPPTVSSQSHISFKSDTLGLDQEDSNQPMMTDDTSLKEKNYNDVFILGPLELFDFISLDDDERFIIWGPDPIALSSSMATATTSTFERPSSYATLYNSQHERPDLQGFSSNTTSTLTNRKSTQTQKVGRFHSIRLSNLRKHTRNSFYNSSSKEADKNNHTDSFQLKRAFGIKRGNKIASNDVSTLTPSTTPTHISKVIEAATVHKLVEKLTSTLDYTFMTDFFLTYRDFIQSQDLCQLLISRFTWALQNDEEIRRIVRIRTFVVIRHWLSNYFVHDFIGNYNLRKILTDFLNQLSHHPLVKLSPRDQRIVKALKRVVHRLKKLYYTRSSSTSRVKIISPPPPTLEQEHLSEMVRAKLSQNAIRRKATIRMDMGSDHHGNLAVQDTRSAPVRVVGSLNMKGSMIDSDMDSPSKFSHVRQQASQISSPSTITGYPLEDVSRVRFSAHHKSFHETPNEDSKLHKTSSVGSVVSEDSLDSDLSAGITIPDEYEEEDDYLSHLQSTLTENDEPDLHWLREQQETIEYFKFLRTQQSDKERGPASPSNPIMSSNEDAESLAESLDSPSIIPNLHKQPPIVDSPDAVSSRPAPSNLAMPDKTDTFCSTVTNQVRRIPSERWCRRPSRDEHDYRHLSEAVTSKALPEELLKELDTKETINNASPLGLSRKLSEKSMERRKSEKNLRNSASLSPISSSALNGTLSCLESSCAAHQKVLETSPLTEDPMDNEGAFASVANTKKSMDKKKSDIKKKESVRSARSNDNGQDDVFTAIPYEQTEDPRQEQATNKKNRVESESSNSPKKKLTKTLSKVFKQSHSSKAQKEEIAEPSAKTSDDLADLASSDDIKDHKESHQDEQQSQKQPSSHFVSRIAEQLRVNLSGEELSATCQCNRCSGRTDTTDVCKRLSLMLITEDERRYSLDLRQKRGTSVDWSHQSFAYPVQGSTAAKNPKAAKNGPVYLGQLDTRSIIESCTTKKVSPSSRQAGVGSDDDQSTESCSLSEKSIPTDMLANSSRAARSSLMMDASMQRSKIIELDIPPVSSASRIHDTGMEKPVNEGSNIPRHIPMKAASGKSFIMFYRTSKLASQFCLIERDVLIKVGWEELVHCKWTKMDANGKINPSYADGYDTMLREANQGVSDMNYTRQLEKKRSQEQGIEYVIQRFNTVCLWVSSEIVRTRNMNDRVKLIEKFIRLAMKCKLYSNYATLVQILLGLQSPTVARLEKTWSKVSARYQKQLNSLTEFSSPMKNWKHIRDGMTEVAEEYGNSPAEVQVEMPGITAVDKQKFKKTRIKRPFGGCIPFLGIYLSDLVFNSEKPRHLKPNLENQRIYKANTTRNMPLCLDQPMVNFRKYRVIATVIKRVLIFQGLAMRYSFDEDPDLKDKCKNLQVLDAALLHKETVAITEYYTSNATHELRLNQQQETIMKALQELSIKVKLQDQQPQSRASSTERKSTEFSTCLSEPKSHAALGDKNKTYSPYYDKSDSIGMKNVRVSLSSYWSVPVNLRQSSETTQLASSTVSVSSNDDHISRNSDSDLSIIDNPEQRDMYGFKKSTQWVNAEDWDKFDFTLR
ncbi:hypothetical protein RO3G_10474 [Rhizopus delemar RA 99-880]|uniref:Ras GEF n=1 Tax=Rhizopus delemar (strain RA 99-880 / ATCC MYA-4621 / FGSC 9543 / NRRL 43880) TaxID=246409 RepID=I1CBD4_RHIO9|nr:hypothetical protein RO3G_10474 [Rhizopus delemar RA 99-880]|eukprot:EIE85764.1 hypothetical protein RO3G_10474 [Rhizopus delemar RA 99-880]